MIMAKQEEIIGKYGVNNPLVTVTQYRKTLSKMIEMAGFKDTTAFINEITPEVEQQIMMQASQPPADPTAEAAKIYAQIEQSKAELKAQADAARNDLDRQKMMIENEQKQLEMQQKAAKDNAELALKEMKLQIEAMKVNDGSNVMKMDSVMKAIAALNDIANSGING
jgi:acetyl/propionyl-CoA carboxylase alpha subunit